MNENGYKDVSYLGKDIVMDSVKEKVAKKPYTKPKVAIRNFTTGEIIGDQEMLKKVLKGLSSENGGKKEDTQEA